jgi:NAD(P)-dependent dehydrogenase (short-subunit alcohol dehydrogenase family)
MAVPDLKEKQVLVTGAAAGIGREIALSFARRGAHIIASDLNPSGLAKLKIDVEELGRDCRTWIVNVGDESAMREFAVSVNEQVGAVDVLVNNAGIASLGKFLESDLAHWRRVIDVNLMGMVHGCYFFLPAMLAAGGARQVVNVASAAAWAAPCATSAYASSKAAAMGFSEVLMMELSQTAIGVTIVGPGIINTGITRRNPNVSDSISERQLSKLQAYYEREGTTPDVVAEAVVDAVKRGRELLMVGPYSRLTFHLKRLSPRLLRALTVKDSKAMGFL